LGQRTVACLYVGEFHVGRAVAWLNVFPVGCSYGQDVPQVLLYHVLAPLRVLAGDGIPVSAAVGAGTFGQSCIQHLGKRGEKVYLGHQGPGVVALFHTLGPRYDEGHSGSAFEGTVLVAAQGTGRFVVAKACHRFIGISVVHNGAVVAGQDYDGVLVYFQVLEGFHYLAHGPVELNYGIATVSHVCLAPEARMREARNVYVVGAKVHEEGFAVVLPDETHGMRGDAVGYVLVFPQSLAASLHETYARDAVYDGLVMTVVGTRFQVVEHFGIAFAGGFASKVLAVTYLYGSRGVVVGDETVFYEHAGHAVAGGCHYVVIVKTDVLKSVWQGSIPVLSGGLVAQSEMPFAYGCRSVACLAEHVGHGVLLRSDNHPGIALCYHCVGPSPRIMPGKQGIARRGACSGRSMGVEETYAVLCQAVHIGSLDVLGAIAAKVAVSQVVGNYENYIGARVVAGRLFPGNG